MEQRRPADLRRTWFVIWFAMTATPVIYFVVALLVAGSVHPETDLASLRYVLSVIALVALAAGVVILVRAPRARAGAPPLVAAFGAEDLASPSAFVAVTIVGCALVEACAILGFVLVFLGAPATNFVPFGLAAIGAMLGVALPTGLRYWGERGRASAGGIAPIE